VDGTALAASVLAGGLVLYLGIDGGGYDVVVRSQVGVIVWWTILVGAAWGILPAGRLTRIGWAGLALFGSFVVWTALGATWSLSSERSLQELSRVGSYLGILLLAVALHRDRQRAVRYTVNAIGMGVAVVAGLALASRLFPGAFPAAQTTAAFLGGAQSRLSWPLNYWNGLGALVALGLPMLLAIATAARRLWAQAVAAAAIPMVVLCGYLTASRGGAIATGVALLAFLALAPDRIPKLGTMLTTAAGSAILIAGAVHRSAIKNGLAGHAATVQGRQLVVTIALVCMSVALAQVGIGFAARHGTLPRPLRVSRGRAQALLGGGIAVALIIALAVGVPSRLSHAWTDFKGSGGTTGVGSDLGARFGSLSGEGRYQFWSVAVHSSGSHVFTGSGPGTFQLLWEPRAPFLSYVVNAHSLYVETLTEVGVVGLALLVGFMVLVIGGALRLVARSTYEERVRAAGATAALLAFAASAAVDWVWQLPVLPAAFLLLAAAVLAPAPPARSVRAGETRDAPAAIAVGRGGRLALRIGLVAVAIGCLVAIAVPLATTTDIRQSQAAVNNGNTSFALVEARAAAAVEPGAASAQLQVALVRELQQKYPAALKAARTATRDEPQNWTGWLVLSRLEAESGHVKASVTAYRRARSLNPRSPLFAQ
jgi:hypothetical protein